MTEPTTHVRPGFCCLGQQWSCGHAATCSGDPKWSVWHDRQHRADRWTWTFFSFSVALALAMIGIDYIAAHVR